MDRSDRAPGRNTRSAESTYRRSWAGYGRFIRVEKSAFGRYLHDLAYVFGEVSFLALPALYYVMAVGGEDAAGATGAALVAWLTMTVVGAAIRSGWFTPPGTDVPGWVSVTPALIGLRLVYFSATVAIAALGGVTVAELVGPPAIALGWSAAVSTVATCLFPVVGERLARWRERSRER